MPFWIPISKGGLISMKQKERFDEKPKQEHEELLRSGRFAEWKKRNWDT